MSSLFTKVFGSNRRISKLSNNYVIDSLLRLGSLSRLEIPQLGGFCEIHTKTPVKYYCNECEVFLCFDCAFTETHPMNNLTNFVDVAEDMKLDLISDRDRVSRLIQINRSQSDVVKDHLQTFIRSVEVSENETRERGEDLKRLVDQNVHDVLTSLSEQKSKIYEQFEYTIGYLDRIAKTLERSYDKCNHLIEEASPKEVFNTFKSVHKLTGKLEQKSRVNIGIFPTLNFLPSNFDCMFKSDEVTENNCVGRSVGNYTKYLISRVGLLMYVFMMD